MEVKLILEEVLGEVQVESECEQGNPHQATKALEQRQLTVC